MSEDGYAVFSVTGIKTGCSISAELRYIFCFRKPPYISHYYNTQYADTLLH